jgi:transcriptional regulator of acetoin/glycerol metabolism
MQRLVRYPFPGNVRELRNVLEFAYILCRGDELQEQCLPPAVLEYASATCFNTTGASPLKTPPRDEKERIIAALAEHGGHRARTAHALGIDASTLWRKMRKYEIA